MAIFSIDNVSVYDEEKNTVIGPQRFSFVASPGNIVDTETDPATVIDGEGCMLIPGLIDSKIDADSAVSSLARFASYGVTTVIDLSSGTADLIAMSAAASQSHSLPSYLAAGSALGHPNVETPTMFPFRAVRNISTPEEADRLVTEMATGPNQADYIKIIADSPGLDDATLVAAAAAARRHGKLPIAHAALTRDFRRAMNAGFRVVTPVPVDEDLDAGTIREFAEQKIAVIPTLGFLRQVLRQTEHPGVGFARAMANVKALSDAGVQICAGSAANKDQFMSMGFGESLHEEMELLVKAGLSNPEALRAATSVPAKVFGLSDRGTLEIGLRADLVLVEGNPLVDISDARLIKKVWIQGVFVSK